MADAVSADDRLPWLDSPRPAKPAATRRARTSLLAMLGLFFSGAIAVMAYLAGRSTAPVADLVPEERIAETQAPVPLPLPDPQPAPQAITPSPPLEAPVEVAPEPPVATPAKVERKAKARPSPPPRPEAPPRPRSVRIAPTIPATPQYRVVWPAQPFAGPPGRVIQLGTYQTQLQADAAWWGVARAYPYLTTLPRMVAWVGPSPGRARTYHVRLAASSRREARALCEYLRRIGRGCSVA